MDKMKQILSALIILSAMAACMSKAKEPMTEKQETDGYVSFNVANNYFFRNGQQIPSSPKITTEDEFNRLFGMAATMGEKGRSTPIDFSKKFVLALVLPVTDTSTEIIPRNVELRNDTLIYTYELKVGEQMSYTIQPVSIIILDKKYQDNTVILASEHTTR